MLTFLFRQVRGEGARWWVLVVGIAAAAAGFTVLTAGVQQSRLQLVGTVQQNSRSAYDVLVRPKGSRSPEEASSDLVRGDFLAGTFGGISQDQLAAVRGIPGVQVAAPLHLVGYVKLPAQRSGCRCPGAPTVG